MCALVFKKPSADNGVVLDIFIFVVGKNRKKKKKKETRYAQRRAHKVALRTDVIAHFRGKEMSIVYEADQ